MLKRTVEANRFSIENSICIFVSIVVSPFLKFIYFLTKKCWRIPVKTADKCGYHQISNHTEKNRYPEIFKYAAYLTIKNQNIPDILSFGCSSGAECHTLRSYFNNGNIVGYDIFKHNIKRANKKNNDNNIHFTSEWTHVSQLKYDIVFLMTVLCRSPHTSNKNDCSKIYSFNQFENQILLLNEVIKTGGLLVIYNANFRFTDTKLSQRYKAIEIPGYGDSGIVPKFDRNNKLLDDQVYVFSIFKKDA